MSPKALSKASLDIGFAFSAITRAEGIWLSGVNELGIINREMEHAVRNLTQALNALGFDVVPQAKIEDMIRSGEVSA
jgi:hypothetical protein